MARLYTWSGFLGNGSPETFSGNGPCTQNGIDPTSQLFSRGGMTYRQGGSSEAIQFAFDPVNHTNSPIKLTTYHRAYLRLWLLPGASEAIFSLNSANGAAFDLVRMFLTTTGGLDLRIWNGSIYQSFGISNNLTIGTVYRIEIQTVYTPNGGAGGADLVTANLRINDAGVVSGSATVGFLVDGSRQCTWGYAGGGAPTAYELDLMELAGDDANWIGATRFTSLAPTAIGTYNQWATDANPDVRNIFAAPDPHGNFGSTGTFASNTLGQKQSFTVESMAGRGITGQIKSLVIAVECLATGTNPNQLLVRRNGVDTLQSFQFSAAVSFICSLFDTTGWAPTDTIEVGVVNQSGGTVRIACVAAIVETTTVLDVAPGNAIRSLSGNYVGTGTWMTVDLGALDPAVTTLRPDFIIIMPGVGGSSPGGWWWDGMRSAHPSWGSGRVRSDAIYAVPGKFYVACPDVNVNQNGVTYTWLAVFDPLRRVTQRGCLALATGTDSRNVPFKDPSFVPLGMFIARGTPGSTTTGNMFWRGPGHVGDQSSVLDSAANPVADVVQAFNTGGFQQGTQIANNNIGFEYCAFKPSGFTTTPLIAVGSYVGDGNANKNIAVALGGLVPACTIVIPLTTTARHVRMGGRCVDFSGTTAATAITAEAANQFTVGTTLNTNGVTYSFISFAPGVDSFALACEPMTTVVAALAQRLGDPNYVHWTAAELQRYLTEALHIWNAITLSERDRGSFTAVSGTPFYDLPTQLPTLLARNLLDQDLVLDIEYAVQEPPSAATWAGTAMFTLAEVTAVIQRRRDRFLLETGTVVTRTVTANVTPDANGRVALPNTMVDARRVAWQSSNPTATAALKRDSEWSTNAYNRTWATPVAASATSPKAYSVGVSPPLAAQLAPPPTAQGTLDTVGVLLGATLNPANGVLLGVPDDFAWAIKWGALADLLASPGPANDPGRAALCEQLWQLGVKAGKVLAVLLDAQINGVPVRITGIDEADQFNRGWQNTSGAPTKVLTAGPNLVALSPVPDNVTPYTVVLDVVRNQIIDVTCYFEGGIALTNALIDYAEFLARFKDGPQQAGEAAESLLQAFLRATGVAMAIDQANLLTTRKALLDESARDKRMTPDQAPPEPRE